jgi:hypothetical protein
MRMIGPYLNYFIGIDIVALTHRGNQFSSKYPVFSILWLVKEVKIERHAHSSFSLDQVGHLLSDHNDRCARMASNSRGENRRIHNSKATNSMNPQLVVHNGIRSGPHFRRPHWMIEGLTRLANMRFDLFVGRCLPIKRMIRPIVPAFEVLFVRLGSRDFDAELGTVQEDVNVVFC